MQVLFEPFKKQQEFIECAFDKTTKYALYGGGIRSGKTFCGLGTLILLCKVFPYTRWAVVRRSLPDLKRNTVPSFMKIVPTNFMKSYNQDTQTVTFNNGSQIIFFAENYDDDKELNRWRGLEVNGFLLEEANELQEVSFYKAIERAGSHIPSIGNKKPKPIILLTCNPSWGWVKSTFYDRHKNGTLPQPFKYIPALIYDNPFITSDADYMASLENLPKLQYEVFVKGNWDVNMNEHPWLFAFDEDKHVKPVDVIEHYPLYISFDFNANPLSCTVWQRSPHMLGVNPFCYAIDEFGGHLKLEDLCNQIRASYPNHIIYVTGDRSGNNEDFGRNQTAYQMIQSLLHLSEAQMNLNTHNLEHFDSRLLCNSMFTNYNVIIDPVCKNLIDDCRKAKVDINHRLGSQLLKDRGENKMDYFDSMRYMFQTYYNEFVRSTYLRATIPTHIAPHIPQPEPKKPLIYYPDGRTTIGHPKFEK
jgi:phage terminase large subunit